MKERLYDVVKWGLILGASGQFAVTVTNGRSELWTLRVIMIICES